MEDLLTNISTNGEVVKGAANEILGVIGMTVWGVWVANNVDGERRYMITRDEVVFWLMHGEL